MRGRRSISEWILLLVALHALVLAVEELNLLDADDFARMHKYYSGGPDERLRGLMLDVIAATAAEITSRLDGTVIDVRLSAGVPEFVITAVPPEQEAPTAYPASGAADDSATARITVRLPDALKGRVEAQAAAEGLSVNSWLVHAAVQAAVGTCGGDPAACHPCLRLSCVS